MTAQDNQTTNHSSEDQKSQSQSQSQLPSWYQKNVTSINPEAQHLLESYSGFKPEEVVPHVVALVRDLRLCSTYVLTSPAR